MLQAGLSLPMVAGLSLSRCFDRRLIGSEKMPKVIDLLADEGSSLDQTLRRALQTLQERGIRTLAAGQILSGKNPPIGRILLCDPSDKERAIRVLVSNKIYVI